MKHCSNCGMDFEGNFCPNCGMAAQGPLKCPKCGAEINGNFCANCGYSVHGGKKAGGNGKTAAAFFKKNWIWLLLGILVLVTAITLMVMFVGLRGIYVNVNDPNDYYDFGVSTYRASMDSLFGDGELEEGKYKLSGSKLILTVEDEDFGEFSDDLDFVKIDGFRRIKIDDKEYKRVSLIGLKSTNKKVTVKFDPQNGNDASLFGGYKSNVVENKIKIGNRLPSLEDWGVDKLQEDYRYVFVGWYTEPDGKGSRYYEGQHVWEDCTYYDYWCKEHVSNTYETTASEHWQFCDRCGLSFNKRSHSYHWVLTKEPTCTQKGEEIYQCECGHIDEASEPREAEMIGHSYDEWTIDEQYYFCGDTVTRRKICLECAHEETEKYVIPHKFNAASKRCGVCGMSEFQIGDTLFFGEYPQTKETDNGIISTLNGMSGDRPSKGNSGKWTDYGYYFGGEKDEYMWYIDLAYYGVRYRGVYFTSYRPYYTSSSFTYKNENGYDINTLYWFKWEPIEWRVLENEYRELFLISNVILDNQQYYKNMRFRVTDIGNLLIYPNNYKESDIRTWLNDTFYNWAFDELEQSVIKETLVDNSASTTGNSSNEYACDNTNDKVFLLSYQEAEQEMRKSRVLQTTSYAQSQGAYGGYEGNGIWWLRSPVGYFVYCVDYDGDTGNSVCDKCYGVVPAIKIQL